MSESSLENVRLQANDFQVSGIVPFSTVDFPGKLAAVLFTQGCHWRCQYCHNKHLWPFAGGAVDLKSICDFLESRRELLDAVVISGGEPLWQPALPMLTQRLLEMGFVVGLHTGGGESRALTHVIGSLSWIGLDYKIKSTMYDSFTECQGSGEEFRRSLRVIQTQGLEFETRTTVDARVHNRDILLEMARELHAWGVDKWVLQKKRELIVSPGSKTWRTELNADLHDLNLLNQLCDIVGKLEVRG